MVGRVNRVVMVSSRANVLCVLLAVVISACGFVERIPDHYCIGWDEGLDAANQIQASFGLDSIALECDRKGGRLTEADVLVQRPELGIPTLGRFEARELYCWGSVNGYTALFDDTRDAQDMLGLSDEDIQDALTRLYQECVEHVEATLGT